MDGYAVDTAINSKGKWKTTQSDFSFGERSLLTPTPAGIHFLLEMEPDLVPYVSKEPPGQEQCQRPCKTPRMCATALVLLTISNSNDLPPYLSLS